MHEKRIQAKAMVATSVPLASEIGLHVLKQGGNAVDAAIAVASALTVLEPTSNGIGGDCFALVWQNGRLHGLNASGPAPIALSRDAILNRRFDAIPPLGWIPVTVPGAVKGWAALHDRFGRIPFADCLAGAIRAANDGYPVSPTVAKYWRRAVYGAQTRFIGTEFRPWFETFTISGSAPNQGEFVRLPNHAKTLQEIADTKGESMYRGRLAEAIDRASREAGGFLSNADLAGYQVEWVEPIHQNYRGYDVHEIPPNGQGIVALEALGILNGLSAASDEINLHRRIEAVKLAFSDALAYVAEPSAMPFDAMKLLAPDYLATRRALIKQEALLPYPGSPLAAGTVYFAVADEEGTMVSFIQSNYMGFGSGIVVPDTGIALHNRGHNFSMVEGHPNMVAPGKRPYHTIIPGFLTKDGRPIGPFGVMGGFMQPQGHVQVLSSLLDDKTPLQEAFDKPRWMWTEQRTLLLESAFDPVLAQALKDRGHDVHFVADEGLFGRGQAIFRDPDTGRYDGATEKRCDGFLAFFE